MLKLFHKEFLDNTAYIDGDKIISYRELYSKAQEIKTEILEKSGIKRQEPIIVYGHKNFLMPACFLGCISNGNPFVPIDESTPLGRVKEIIELSNSKLVLNCSSSHLDIDCIQLNDTISSDRIEFDYLNSNITTGKESVYIMFTSGSTGLPKGVKIPAEALEDFLAWTTRDFNFEREIFINHSLFNFDVSVFELWTAFSCGFTVLPLNHINNLNTRKNIKIISEYQGTALVATPAFLDLLLMDKQFNDINLPSLKKNFLAGEALQKATIKKVWENFKDIKLYNMYGPTEATCVVTSILITEEILKKYPSVPIGWPKAKTVIEVDKNQSEMSGEIIIIGSNVSTGYLKGVDADKFFLKNGIRAYKTGDLGYYQDGMVFYEGRIDRQIKIHGHRIELDEIEVRLRNIPLIQNSAVFIDKKGHDKRIIAAVVVDKKKDLGVDSIYEKLKCSCPQYMLPHDIFFIDTIPFNSRGKTDRSVLEKIYLGGIRSGSIR